MGNATKVALVALLILMVVVVARFVREDTAAPDPEGDKATGTKPAVATSKQPPESIARPRTSVNPGVRRVDPGAARSTAVTSRPTENNTPIARQGALPSSAAGASAAGSPPTSSQSQSTAPPPGSTPAPGTGALPQSAPESRTAGSIGVVVPVDRPPAVPRTSNGEPLPAPPAKESASTAIASDTPTSRAGTPGSQPGA